MSETSTCRERLAPFCFGNGLDLGFGGDPILPSSICIDRAEDHASRSKCENPSPTHITGDIWNLEWFKDGSLDYVFSSHALEDAEDTRAVISEWMRVLKPGGHLVLFLPDQKTYEEDCRRRDYPPNKAHIHADFSLKFVKDRLPFKSRVVHEEWPFPGNPYSFAIVVKKL